MVAGSFRVFPHYGWYKILRQVLIFKNVTSTSYWLGEGGPFLTTAQGHNLYCCTSGCDFIPAAMFLSLLIGEIKNKIIWLNGRLAVRHAKTHASEKLLTMVDYVRQTA